MDRIHRRAVYKDAQTQGVDKLAPAVYVPAIDDVTVNGGGIILCELLVSLCKLVQDAGNDILLLVI